MPAPRRNIEVKARDTDPERSLAVCHELGAEDHGVLVQRDTYFKTTTGRLKLREEHEGATLVQYDRPDAARARLSSYRLVPVDDAEGLRTALEAALGTLVVVEKERHLFIHDGVRIHLDTVKDLGTFLELEGVAPPESDLEPETRKVAALQEALGIEPEHILTDSYSDQLLGPDALIEAARAVMQRAYAPYSRYVVGAALRADDGSIHVAPGHSMPATPAPSGAETMSSSRQG